MFDFIFFIYLLYGYKVGFIDYSILIPFIMLFSYIIFKNEKIILSLPKLILYLISIFFILFIIAGLSTVYNGSFVSEYYLKPIRVILVLTLIYFYFYYRKIKLDKLLKVLLYVLLLNSIVVLLQYILFYFSISNTFLFHPDIGFVEAYRKPGLTSGFPTGGMLSIFGSFLAIYLYFKFKNFLYLYLFFIFSLSVFLTARSAMYLFLVLTPLYLYLFGIIFNRLRILLYFVIVSLLIISLIYNNMNPILEGTVNKMFANVINYMETGDFNDYSTRHMLSSDHFKFPDTLKDIIIGNSLPHTSSFVVSDISYFRILWSNGIFALFLYMMAFFLIWFNSYSKSFYKKLSSQDILVTFVFFIVFIMCFKGSYLFSRVIGDFLIIIFIWRKYFDKKENCSFN
jgi:hypothetical protein